MWEKARLRWTRNKRISQHKAHVRRNSRFTFSIHVPIDYTPGWAQVELLMTNKIQFQRQIFSSFFFLSFFWSSKNKQKICTKSTRFGFVSDKYEDHWLLLRSCIFTCRRNFIFGARRQWSREIVAISRARWYDKRRGRGVWRMPEIVWMKFQRFKIPFASWANRIKEQALRHHWSMGSSNDWLERFRCLSNLIDVPWKLRGSISIYDCLLKRSNERNDARRFERMMQTL